MISKNYCTLPRIALMIFISILLLSPIQSFSTLNVWNSRPIRCDGRPSSTSSILLASNDGFAEHIYQDDECQDLCGAWEEGWGGNQTSSTMTTPAAEDVIQAPVVRRSKPSAYRSSHRLRRDSLWSDPKPSVCKSCSGEGGQVCRFCGGTDFLSAIGGDTDVLFYEGIGKDCPVCKDGVEVCHECAGTGYVYSWELTRNFTTRNIWRTNFMIFGLTKKLSDMGFIGFIDQVSKFSSKAS
eukprot:CCRYP_005332-RA/>CCRYP_005332-RA protein AED:0.07 eAED:0.06 QI:0/0/0.5/1/0/0/2/1211/238